MFILKEKQIHFGDLQNRTALKNSQMEPDERSWLRREKTVTVV